jgi:hypothetical protein
MVTITWLAFFIGAIFIAGAGLSFNNRLNEIKDGQAEAKTRGLILRAWSGCTDIINDGEISLTEECLDPEVAVWYPPDICAKIPVEIPNCGSKATVLVDRSG